MSPIRCRPRPAIVTAALLVATTSPANAQSDGLSVTSYALLAAAVVLIVLVVMASLRRKSVQGADVAPEPAEDVAKEPPEAVPTLRSTMGLMSTQVEGPLADTYFEIKDDGLTIGRDPQSCEVVYEDEMVSRQHARLEYGTEGLVLRNLSTTNQTFLNDEAITEAVVRAGDRIRIEQVTFRVYPHRGAVRSS